MNGVFDRHPKEAFQTFSVEHLSVLVLVVFIGALIYLYRETLRDWKHNRQVRLCLAGLMLLLEFFLTAWMLYTGSWSLQHSLPLQLCDLALITSALMLMTKNRALFEVTYFWGLAGATQALLTPDTAYHFPHVLFLIFFTWHALIVLACLWMTFVERLRPSFISVFKSFGVTNLYALVIMGVNVVLGSNYLYLMHKPSQQSLLDVLGPWPWYLLSLEIVCLVLYTLCYLPFWFSDIQGQARFAPPSSSI